MTAIPAAVTIEQRRAACRALGLPSALVRELRVTLAGVDAVLLVRDREGRTITHGTDALTTTVHIPCGEEVTPNADARP